MCVFLGECFGMPTTKNGLAYIVVIDGRERLAYSLTSSHRKQFEHDVVEFGRTR